MVEREDLTAFYRCYCCCCFYNPQTLAATNDDVGREQTNCIVARTHMHIVCNPTAACEEKSTKKAERVMNFFCKHIYIVHTTYFQIYFRVKKDIILRCRWHFSFGARALALYTIFFLYSRSQLVVLLFLYILYILVRR